MDEKILLSLIMVHVENRLKSLPSPQRGPRGPSGIDGADGRDGKDGSNGRDGRDGRDGKDGISFKIENYEEEIRQWIAEASLTFDKLSASQLESLRGPQGRDGKDGGAFNIEDHKDALMSFLSANAPKFEQLTEDEKESLRGPRGHDGKRGQDFNLENSLPEILEALKPIVEETFKLSDEDKEYLRGPSGKDGRDGKDFVFEDCEHDIWELVKTAVNNSSDELKLKFSDLTEEEISSLKLTFSDLTDAEKDELKGARGARGPRGQAGPKGEDGKHGLNGTHGRDGKNGTNGVNGIDGKDGQDAPQITDVRIVEEKEKIYFRFYFSDNTYLETNKIKRPSEKVIETLYVGARGGSGGGGGGDNSVIVSDDITSYGPRKEIEFSGDLIVTPVGADKVVVEVDASIGIAKDGTSLGEMKTLDIGEGIDLEYDAVNKIAKISVPEKPDPLVLYGYTCEADVYVGSVVFLYRAMSEALLIEWTPVEIAVPLNFEMEFPQAGLAIASNPLKSRPIGICIARYTVNGREKCDISRGMVEGYTGLDIGEDYFLSGDVAGAMVPENTLSLTSGSYKVRVAQPISEEAVFFNRGDRHYVT